MAMLYQQEVIAWANQQAALLRAGRFSEIDLERVAEEIADVGKSEQRELAHRMAVLLAHLLKWRFQVDVGWVSAQRVTQHNQNVGLRPTA